jgi:hypothetical protein
VLVGLEAASGDQSPNDDEINTFDTLYPLGHMWFGFVDAVGRRNVIGPNLGLRLQPTDALKLRLDLHHFERLEDDDVLYDVADVQIVPVAGLPPAGASKEIGQEIDFVASYTFNRFVKLDLGYCYLFAGDYVKQLTQGEDWSLFYAWLYMTF